MYEWKKQSWPDPDLGISFEGIESLVVPDQSLTLQEILERFTRKEELPIALDAEGGFDDDEFDNPLNVDLEKMAMSDLTEKEAYVKELRKVRAEWQRQEDERLAKDESARAMAKAAQDEQALRKKIAEENSAKSA